MELSFRPNQSSPTTPQSSSKSFHNHHRIKNFSTKVTHPFEFTNKPKKKNFFFTVKKILSSFRRKKRREIILRLKQRNEKLANSFQFENEKLKKNYLKNLPILTFGNKNENSNFSDSESIFEKVCSECEIFRILFFEEKIHDSKKFCVPIAEKIL